MIYYTLVDVLIGMIPFTGNILDFFVDRILGIGN